jgi:hypothetical protein
MGTMAGLLSKNSVSAIGREIWDEHQHVVSLFWNSIASFFSSEAGMVTKIYQDGMITAGENGLKIINEGVNQGSVNYRIIAGLIQKGAVLIKTEDIALVQREYDFIKKITSAKSNRERETAAMRYKLAERKLLAERDSYIAGVIDSTLIERDMGVLFIGAYHEVLLKLPADIQITQVKEVARVLAYHKILSNINEKNRAQYQQLAEYLASLVLIT